MDRRASASEWADAFRNVGRKLQSSSDKRLHFGLGAAEAAKVEVCLAIGDSSNFKRVHADQFLEVREPEKP